ncbi:pirin family protein [Methanocella sp. MCL-LM]|uniref:pirin family protein n=1 Tax=Methanocella sp. MCL-LM TaxID=3412035 RepID=UPI003C77F11A
MVRMPHEIYQARGQIENGTFTGKWHFTFGSYKDPKHMGFGPLRVFNDDTLSPGAVWPLHPHKEIEVVTYCVDGIFRHADQRGEGGLLRAGGVQHTTVGTGMVHSEINASWDKPMRFIQMWFKPDEPMLQPSVEQKSAGKADRTDRLFPLVSNRRPGALRIHQDAEIFSSFLQAGKSLPYDLNEGRGAYLYVLSGGPVTIAGHVLPAGSSAEIVGPEAVVVTAEKDSELLLVDVPVAVRPLA